MSGKDQLEGALPKSEIDLRVKLHSLIGTFEDELKESPVENNNNNNNCLLYTSPSPRDS